MALRVSEAHPILTAVVDGPALGPEPRVWAAALFAAGVDWIQLRDRRLDAGPLHAITTDLVAAARNTSGGSTCRVLVNRRADVALAGDADGVHLGFDGLDDAAIARLFPDGIVGRSYHSVEEIQAALGTRLDYVHLAPIWDPRSKPASRPALGLDTLRQATAIGIPVLAQGGLDPERAKLAIECGASGIAVTGALPRPPAASAVEPVDDGESPNSVAALAPIRALRAALDAARG